MNDLESLHQTRCALWEVHMRMKDAINENRLYDLSRLVDYVGTMSDRMADSLPIPSEDAIEKSCEFAIKELIEAGIIPKTDEIMSDENKQGIDCNC